MASLKTANNHSAAPLFWLILALLLLALVYVATVVYALWGTGHTTVPGAATTDTVYVNHIQHDTIVRVQEVYKPYRVTVYLPDSIRRKRLEKDTLITGAVIGPKGLQMHTIAPNGVTMLGNYDLPTTIHRTITIDAEGQVQVSVDSAAIRREQRNAKWRRIGTGALGVGVFILGYWAGSR